MYVTPGRITSWQAEQTADGGWLPSVRSTMLLFAVITVLLLAGLGHVDRELAVHQDDGKPATLCAEHTGRPGWSSVCAERP